MTGPEPSVRTSVAGAIATVTLSRPTALNAITREMLEQLSITLERISSSNEVRVVILTGEGRAFSAGVDLKALGQRSLEGGEVGDFLDIPARKAIHRMTTMPQVIIARINGFCFTGALELALACDLIVVATEAKLSDTHAKRGLRPTWGMSQRLVRAVGISRARELSFTARTFSGSEAAAWGLANRAVPLAELDDAVNELASAVVANSPGSIAAFKDLYHKALNTSLDDGIAYEAENKYSIDDTEDRVATFR